MGRAPYAVGTDETATSAISDEHTPSRVIACHTQKHDVYAGPRESRREIRYGVKNYGRNGRTLS